MWLLLLAWLAGSAIFIAGWVLGAIMERRHAVPGTQGADRCEACLLRAIEAQLAGEPLMPSTGSLE
jgi:hypothetical protein